MVSFLVVKNNDVVTGVKVKGTVSPGKAGSLDGQRQSVGKKLSGGGKCWLPLH
jgi:hypothetical protein